MSTKELNINERVVLKFLAKSIIDERTKLREENEREYTIEKQVAGMGYMSFYDEEDMRSQIVYCTNGCWKLKGDDTAKDLDGKLCITDDEEEEEKEIDYMGQNHIGDEFDNILYQEGLVWCHVKPKCKYQTIYIYSPEEEEALEKKAFEKYVAKMAIEECRAIIDKEEDLDICGETGREFYNVENPVKGCGKKITEDDENIMIGNISYCCACGESGLNDA